MMRIEIVVSFILGMGVALAQDVTVVSPAFPQFIGFDKIRDFTMDDTGTEAYFTIQSPTEEVSVITRLTQENEVWGQPKIASFSGKYKDLEPFIAPDQLRLYFISNRPLHDSITEPKDFDIWYVERTTPKEKWSKPINLGSPVNTEHNEFYPSLSENGNLYFTSDNPKAIGRDDIFFSVNNNGTYTEPIRLSEAINSEGFEYNAYISKDESYLIFGAYNRVNGKGSGDLYVSYKMDAGWTEATSLPDPINSERMDYCPFVDEKNQMLYFTSRRFRNPNDHFSDMNTLNEFLESYENGNSRIYKVPLRISEPD